MRKRYLMTAAVLPAVLFLSMTAAFVFAEEKEEPPAASLSGQVLHTQSWEARRRQANLSFEKAGSAENLRSENTFWSGEKFILTARAEGERLPAFVDVSIEGTGYRARLYADGERDGTADAGIAGTAGSTGNAGAAGETAGTGSAAGAEDTDGAGKTGGTYRGQLFEEDMLYRWGQQEAETLRFIFEAVIDGRHCVDETEIVIDDRQPYWQLHRKR